MLYSKEHDHLDLILNSIPSFLPTETQKDPIDWELLKHAKLLNSDRCGVRINDHFAAAEKGSKTN